MSLIWSLIISKQAAHSFFSLTRIKVGFLARGLRQKVLESSHGDGFFSRISTRKILIFNEMVKPQIE